MDQAHELSADESAYYAQAWFLFAGLDGAPCSIAEDTALRIAIGATKGGRVRVIVPDGLDLSPDLAEHVAARISEAVAVARARSGTDSSTTDTIAEQIGRRSAP